MCNLDLPLPRDADRSKDREPGSDGCLRPVARLLLAEMSWRRWMASMVRKKVSGQDIAKMIGASREMVSRVM